MSEVDPSSPSRSRFWVVRVVYGLPSGKRLHKYILWKNPPFFMGILTITGPFSIAMLVITRGYIPSNPIKPPFSYGFPMVFLSFNQHNRQMSSIRDRSDEWRCPQFFWMSGDTAFTSICRVMSMWMYRTYVCIYIYI